MGLSAYGDNHQIIGNRLVGAVDNGGYNNGANNLGIPRGDGTQDDVGGGANIHPASRNALVAGNIVEGTGEIRIGGSNYCCVPAQNTVVCENSGTMVTKKVLIN